MAPHLHLMLQRSGVLTPQQLDLSVREAKERNVALLDLLVQERHVDEETLAQAFSEWLHVPRVALDPLRIDAAVLSLIPERVLRRHVCIPIRLSGSGGKNLVVAMANPFDTEAIRDLQFSAQRTVEPVVSRRSEIASAIDRHYGGTRDVRPAPDARDAPAVPVFLPPADGREVLNLDADSSDAEPAVAMCDYILREAIAARASDIHIEPDAQGAHVRIRVDGVLRPHLEMPPWLLRPLISRIKVLGKLDIAQQRVPQDGRISTNYNGRSVNIRVSTLPTHYGEKIVLRLLGSAAVPALGDLGLSAEERELVRDIIAQPQGMVLVTGPTGAGKSTTLYSMLRERTSPAVNIVTIEDPIEYQVDDLSQVQVDAKAGLTFAKSLRAILRQDPDIILVGEIRDSETAEVAFQAALTGHLVLSTLHTNSSVAAISRLLDLGLKPALITAALTLVIAQRLARRVCEACRAPYVPEAAALRKVGMEPGTELSRGTGCAACAGTGYAGRVGIFELLTPTDPIRQLVREHAGDRELGAAARAGGTRFLLDDALCKVRVGLTTVEEIGRVMQVEREVRTARMGHSEEVSYPGLRRASSVPES